MGISIDRGKFFEGYRQRFGGISAQVSALTHIVENLDRQLGLMAADDLLSVDKPHRPAYMLATQVVETTKPFAGHGWLPTFGPVEEHGSDDYFIKMYSPHSPNGHRAALAKANGMRGDADALTMHGNGFVQLTWLNNYRRASEMLHRRYGIVVDLVQEPALARDFDIAYKVMSAGMDEGLFSGRGFKNYEPPHSRDIDLVGMRKIINGTNRAIEISRYGVQFLNIIKGAL